MPTFTVRAAAYAHGVSKQKKNRRICRRKKVYLEAAHNTGKRGAVICLMLFNM
jgi:hypothetical protein